MSDKVLDDLRSISKELDCPLTVVISGHQSVSVGIRTELEFIELGRWQPGCGGISPLHEAVRRAKAHVEGKRRQIERDALRAAVLGDR